MIKNILIKNFRSIHSLTIDSNALTTFVGPNDVGKSNLLRALNLFFNGYTDHGIPFSFDKDFNKYAKPGTNKAKQIEIELTIALPVSFQKQGKPNLVTWKKVWREGGLHLPLLKQRYTDGSEFSSYSKIPTFLERLAFYYVPAIKDRHFFTDLQGQMYDILAEAAESTLRDSAKDFEESIQTHITELMALVTTQFGDRNEIRLPESLRIVFESLEFNADDMPLSRRGDGIKVRHIPMILKFIGEKRNSLLTGGSIKYTNIWGFEEPENNLELSAAFDMAKSFEETANGGCQIFITTHSPAFYSIGKDAVCDEAITSTIYGVKKENNTSMIYSDPDEKLHDEMGLMPLIAPFVKKEQERWNKILTKKNEDLEKLNKEADYQTPRMFVEGVTDKTLFTKTIELYYPHAKGNIRIDCGDNDGYGSANAVVSRAVAWQLIQQTKPEPVCPAAAVFDGDDAGDNSDTSLDIFLEKLNSSRRNISKSFKLKPSRQIGQLRKKGFKLANDLESYYPDKIWHYASDNGWLEDADIAKRLSTKKINAHLLNKSNYLDGLAEIEIMRVTKRWKKDAKETAAKYICDLPEKEIQEALYEISLALKQCIQHLYPIE